MVRSVLIAALVLLAPAIAQAKPKPKKPAAAAPASGGRKGPANLKLPPESDAGGDSSASASAPPPSRGPTRIDFDDRLIQGQTNKSGAVYLYDRKELKTRSMVKKRETFRDEIISSVYDG